MRVGHGGEGSFGRGSTVGDGLLKEARHLGKDGPGMTVGPQHTVWVSGAVPLLPNPNPCESPGNSKGSCALTNPTNGTGLCEGLRPGTCLCRGGSRRGYKGGGCPP